MPRKRLQDRPDNLNVAAIARLVGKSTATVSRALNNKEGVSREVREMVLEACARLGYMPNSSARALRRNRTDIVGAVIPTLNNSIYARMLESLQRRLAAEGIGLLHTTSAYDVEAETAQALTLVERGVQGLVMVGGRHQERLIRVLSANNIPYVSTYVHASECGGGAVGFDNMRATYQLVDFLVQLGHRRFALITGVTKDNDRVEARLRGIRARLEEAGIALDPELVTQSRYTIEGGYSAMKALAERIDRFTALVCGSDVLAVGALSACRELGIAVPGQLSIVGFDNLEVSEHTVPPLTTINVPANDMGTRAAELLIDSIRNGRPPGNIALKTNIILRGTTAPPR